MQKNLRKIIATTLSAAMIVCICSVSVSATKESKSSAGSVSSSSTSSSTMDLKDAEIISNLEISNQYPAIKASELKNIKTLNTSTVKAMADTAGTSSNVTSSDTTSSDTTSSDVTSSDTTSSDTTSSDVTSSDTTSSDTTSSDVTSSDTTSSDTTSSTVDTPTVYSLSGSMLAYTTSLTSSSSETYYKFSVSSDKYMALGLSSSNTNYYAWLLKYNSSSNSFVAQDFYVAAGNSNILSDLPSGEYALAVFSTGTVGDSYTIEINCANPANPTNTYILTFDLMVFGYTTGIDTTDAVDAEDLKYGSDYDTYNSVYVNGSQLFQNNAEVGTALDWKNTKTVSTTYTYNNLSQIIREVHFNPLGKFYHVSYSSSFASSNNALLIPLGKYTYFLFHHTYRVNNKTQYDTWYDPSVSNTSSVIARVTPRYLDKYDLYKAYLVYDLNTNTVIDLYGELNTHIGETTPTFTQIS